MSHVLDSWRPKTRDQYAVYQRKWRTFCVEKGIDVLDPGFNPPLNFLCMLFDSGLKYGAMNTARSALSCILKPIEGMKFGVHPVTIRVLKSFYNKRPPCARYGQMWNPQIVVDFLRECIPNRSISLKKLTLKLNMLLLLATCSRLQRIHSIKRSKICFEIDGSVVIRLDELQKHSSKGKSIETLTLLPFDTDKGICVVRTLKDYLERTKDISNAGDRLLCSFCPPHGGVGIQTIGRWTRIIMKDAGIDVDLYKAHSTRSASASAMACAGTPIADILKKGAWSHESTFRQFYLRTINQVWYALLVKKSWLLYQVLRINLQLLLVYYGPLKSCYCFKWSFFICQ